jgi:hypothetical protein
MATMALRLTWNPTGQRFSLLLSFGVTPGSMVDSYHFGKLTAFIFKDYREHTAHAIGPAHIAND